MPRQLGMPLDARMHEPPQQCALAIEERACDLHIDDPPPRIRDIERREDLRRTPLRYHEEPTTILTCRAIAFTQPICVRQARPALRAPWRIDDPRLCVRAPSRRGEHECRTSSASRALA